MTRLPVYKLLLLSLVVLSRPVFGQGFTFWLNVTSFGAKGDGINDDTNAIQAAINAAAGAGNVVYMPSGVYKTTHTIAIATNIWLRGAGIGQTVIRPVPSSSGGYPPYNANGQYWYGILTAAGVNHITISDLTIDLATNRVGTNGIELGYDGIGNVTSNATITRCEVLGAPGSAHQYLIWSHRATYVQITHNFINGNETASGSQEGIEYFGGSAILLFANNIINVSSNGINGFAGDTQGSADSIIISENHIENANSGMDLTGDYQGGQPQNLTNVTIHANTIKNVRVSGIAITKQPQATIAGVNVSGNVISGAQDGIHLFSNVNGNDPNWKSISIVGNTIQNSNPNSSGAIMFWGVSDALFEGNLVNGSNGQGMNIIYSSDITIANNRIENTSGHLINLSATSRINIKGNYFSNWDIANAAQAGISGSGDQVIISDNSFYRSSGDPYVTALAGDSDQISFNHLLYASARSATDNFSGDTNRNTGTFAFSSGAITLVVTNTLVSGDSRILLVQTGGAPKAWTVTRVPGSFTVTLSSAAVGNETFLYELFQ